MFVLNPCRTDVRVLREATTLVQAGHAVTIMARTDEAYAASGEEEDRDGVRIVRVPVAAGPVRWLLLARVPRRFRVELAASTRVALAHPPWGWLRIAGAVVVLPLGLVLLPLAVMGGVAFLAFFLSFTPAPFPEYVEEIRQFFR